jgi:hypothetical protein
MLRLYTENNVHYSKRFEQHGGVELINSI